jgi:Tol biopolymer transport system component
MEYAPAITPDGLTLYYVTGSQTNADIWSSAKANAEDTLFEAPKKLDPPINSSLPEGTLTFSEDGQIALFTACNQPDGIGDCDIYEVKTTATPDGTQGVIRNLAELNSPYWESQPALSSDGNTMYFVSNRPGARGGLGDADIYMSRRREDGRWGAPVNIGGPINSSAREDSPCLAMGDSVLFFASTRSGGRGGFDIYASVHAGDGSWGTPQNLGEVFNSSADDRFISVTPDGRIFYYSSTRKDLPHAGDFDIFMVRTVR